MVDITHRPTADDRVPSERVDRGEVLSKIHPRQWIHGGICVLTFLLYLWPGGLLANTIEPRILGFPFYVFWVMFLLPLVNFVNLLLYARFMIARDRELKRQRPDRADWE